MDSDTHRLAKLSDFFADTDAKGKGMGATITIRRAAAGHLEISRSDGEVVSAKIGDDRSHADFNDALREAIEKLPV